MGWVDGEFGMVKLPERDGCANGLASHLCILTRNDNKTPGHREGENEKKNIHDDEHKPTRLGVAPS